MRTLTSGTLTVQAYDVNVWLQERNVLRIKDPGATKVSIGTSPSAELATYTLDANKEAVVDMSDYMRTHAIATDIYVRSNSGDDVQIVANYNPIGLINPLNVLVPYSDSGLLIQAPSMIYETIKPGLFAAEFMSTEENIGVFQYLRNEPTRLNAGELVIYTPFFPNSFTGLTIGELLQERAIHAGSYEFNFDGVESLELIAPYRWVYDNITIYTKVRNPKYENDYTYIDTGGSTVYYICNGEYWDTETLQNILVRKLECNRRYAAVRWVSFTGKTRVHTFELRDATQTADEVIKLETLDGTYNQIKGRTDGFKLYLDELTAYDYWYYADVITSSKVEVSLDGTTWQQVEVTTKSVTIPNTSEGKTNKLEIIVNWRNYDAVTM